MELNVDPYVEGRVVVSYPEGDMVLDCERRCWERGTGGGDGVYL